MVLTSFNRNLPLALLCVGRLWHGHREYPLLESCVDPVEIDAFWQRDRTLDRAEATLREHVVPAPFLPFVLLSPLMVSTPPATLTSMLFSSIPGNSAVSS